MNRITESLDALAERSTPRGPSAVLDGARTVVRTRRRRRRTAGVVVAGVAAVLVVAIGLAPGDGDRVETEGVPATAPSPSGPSSSSAPSSGPSPTASAPTTTATTTTPSSTTLTAPDGDGSPGSASPSSRPGPETTGPTDVAALVPRSADEIEAMMQPGAVIENVAITGGNIDVLADDVTIRNFRLDAGGAPYGFRSTDGRTGFVAEDGEISGVASAGFYGRDAVLRRLDVHDSDGAAFKLLTGVTVERSWWHQLGRGGSGIGVQFEDDGGGTNAVRGNHCDLPVTVAAPYNSDACVLVSDDAPWTLTIEGNWFNGGNYTVDCGSQAAVDVRDNRFGRDLRRLPLVRCPTASGNVWADTGAPIP